MLGAAPRQAFSLRRVAGARDRSASAPAAPFVRRRVLPHRAHRFVAVGAAGAIVAGFLLASAGVGAAAVVPAAQRGGTRTSPRVVSPKPLPRLWPVQVEPGRHGWFDRSLLAHVREDGINALALNVAGLGRTTAGERALSSIRAFAASKKLYLVAVLPPGKARTPAARNALDACVNNPSSFFRCAVEAPSAQAAPTLARRAGSARQLVAVYVSSPRRVASLAGLPSSLRRLILVIAPLHRRFDALAWGEAIGRTVASGSVYMGVAPKTPQASSAVREFAATLAGGGRKPLSAPSRPSVTSVTQTSLTLAWSAAAARATATAGYRLFLNGAAAGTTTATRFSFTGLSCGTSYTLGVSAYDAAGDQSAIATTSRSTSACADVQAPSAPTGLATSGLGSSSVTLSWHASSDNVGVAGYREYLNGSRVGSSSTTSYRFGGLSCQTG